MSFYILKYIDQNEINYFTQVDIGSKKNWKGSSLNPLHWAVYTGNIDAVKAIINNCVFNIITVGKVPSDTGLANESETSSNIIFIIYIVQDLDTQHESKHYCDIS